MSSTPEATGSSTPTSPCTTRYYGVPCSARHLRRQCDVSAIANLSASPIGTRDFRGHLQRSRFGFWQSGSITVPAVFTVTGTAQKEAGPQRVAPGREGPTACGPFRFHSEQSVAVRLGVRDGTGQRVALVDAGWPRRCLGCVECRLGPNRRLHRDVRAVVVTHLHPTITDGRTSA